MGGIIIIITDEKHEFGRRFQCESCPMRFFAKFHLQNHMRIHTGEKRMIHKQYTHTHNIWTLFQWTNHLIIFAFYCYSFQMRPL